MNITVSESAKNFIRQKGGAFYFDDAHTSASCCIHVNFGPSVRLGIPHNKQAFQLMESDGITRYVPEAFVSPFPLTIVVSRFLWYQYLAIEGWKLM